MQNIINFDVRGYCECACVCNIHNGIETITLFFEAETYTDPQIEITKVGDTILSTDRYDLEVANGYAFYELDHTIFTKDEYIIINYIDGSKVGSPFWFRKTAETFGASTTMRVDKISVDEFQINFIASEKSEINAYSPDNFEVTDDGELTIKSPQEIQVTKTGDVITNVTLIYAAATETEPADQKSYDCTYDADGNLTKFGDLPITWGGG